MTSSPRGYVNQHGYRRVRVPGTRKLWMEHVVVWQRHHGPIQPGMEIHHINGDKLDNRIENLMLVTRLVHKRIHSGCYRCHGRWFKRCRRCRWYRAVDSEFYVYPGRGRNGVMGICKRCAVVLAVENKRRRNLRRKAERITADGVAGTDMPQKTPAIAAGVPEGEAK